MNKVYIVEAKRTAIGRYLGSLKDTSPVTLGACVVAAILAKTGIDAKDIDEVIIGNILSAGQGQGIARQIALGGGVDQSVPAYSVNMVCGSGMKSVMLGYTEIAAGFAHCILAGGSESMSQAPYLIPYTARSGFKMGQFEVIDHILNDALTDSFDKVHMGMTAETIAKEFRITREVQEQYAYQSQQKAIRAVDSGRFMDEIVPLEINEKTKTVIFDTDEYPNRTSTLEKMERLKPAFQADGTVTAGTSSGINDGASLVLLADEEMIERYQLTPLAEIVGVSQVGINPSLMGMGPVEAIQNVCKKTGISLDSIDLLEINEAFAAQSIAVIQELGRQSGVKVDQLLQRTNVNGGAIALGHPVGASGNRIIVSLIHEMKKRKANYGIASLCIGGGMGTAILLKQAMPEEE